jgi:hypothetical protein
MVDPVKALPDVTFNDPELLVLRVDATYKHKYSPRPASRTEACGAIQEITSQIAP